ncbi:hypothetical protein H8356DRAFT_1306195 [Neocallimastix lanati (nom. inval.)]|jgi:U4/U6.U5 tri-snRNP component SNU23|uniref:Matrin-type domain-containing protein n=1 Tax=Neocallimastix californiae TaxID=1754190 RepID=A0A1Y2ACZ8_9FUNG|nr:hypothetical protein H8356DRAFT_1306195 [Neocallimastix sp. JGI-2020a]ORY20392.1 hypothetical protein LY90DRAFT_676766 [Neocallimastix californiae]|eukprot:ORY20392.1 hypothetical protein LY90DRAFT_676766 [Neocallimastix californiae]
MSTAYKGSEVGGDTNFRRTWDREEYEKRAKERERESEKAKIKEKPTELLKARKEKLELDKYLGKSQVVQTSGSAAKQPGFYCKVCDCTIKDSVNYLDHINGKRHQSKLNRTMKVERSSIEDVRAKLAKLKKKKEEPERELTFDERIDKAKKDEERRKELKKLRKKEKKRRKREQEEQDSESIDPELAAIMGFKKFKSSK